MAFAILSVKDDESWKEVASGVYRLDGTLLVVMGVGRLLNFTDAEAA